MRFVVAETVDEVVRAALEGPALALRPAAAQPAERRIARGR